LEGFTRAIEKEIEDIRAENQNLNRKYKDRLDAGIDEGAIGSVNKHDLKRFWESLTRG
jgi:tetrahydromethanopterin S-methyltransferase subunit F